MLGYIYKITNLCNGKIYIGQHKRLDRSLVELDKRYWGSGIKLKNAIKKYGKENFLREILFWSYDANELNQKEREYIKDLNSADDAIGYNIAEGGAFGNSVKGKTEEEKAEWRENISKGTKKAMDTPEMHEKLKESNKKTPEWRENLSKALTGKPGHKQTEEQKKQFSERNKGNKYGLGNKSRTGMKNSPEMNKKISESGKKVVHTPEWNKKSADARRGKKMSEEQKAKLRKPKKRALWRLPDGSIREMCVNSAHRIHKDWEFIEYINDDNVNE